MKLRQYIVPGLLLALGLSSCTKNFESYNTNSSSLTTAQTIAVLPTAFGPLQQAIYADYQTAQNLSADGFAGFFMSPTPFKAAYDLNYFLIDGWDRNGYVDEYNQVMAPVSKIAATGVRTSEPALWAVALILQVEAMDRVTDRFGPIPYSKAGTSVTAVPYDSQQEVYNEFFADLDTAVANLSAYVGAHPGDTTQLGVNDLVYAGHYEKWWKYANSLRLRLAMRIVKADATTAQTQAVKALTDPGGVLMTPADDAKFAQSAGRNNDVWLVASDYGDCRMNAALMTYMTGFNDPRLPVYATPAVDPTAAAAAPGGYEGIRIGINIAAKTDYEGYASPNTTTTFARTQPQYLMSSAEVWFLKAEAALRGWSTDNVQTDYETGITTSFQQWGVSSGTYLSDGSSLERSYKDPKGAAGVNDADSLSTITIKWDAAATQEVQLERIITQKWIAIFPDGQEAWADYRRTGYPRLFPVVVNNSAGAISTTVQIRRLDYPQSEYTTNAAAVNSAVSTLLGGPDVGGTRLWWDVANKGNF
jgi:hypothetical protein